MTFFTLPEFTLTVDGRFRFDKIAEGYRGTAPIGVDIQASTDPPVSIHTQGFFCYDPDGRTITHPYLAVSFDRTLEQKAQELGLGPIQVSWLRSRVAHEWSGLLFPGAVVVEFGLYKKSQYRQGWR